MTGAGVAFATGAVGGRRCGSGRRRRGLWAAAGGRTRRRAPARASWSGGGGAGAAGAGAGAGLAAAGGGRSRRGAARCRRASRARSRARAKSPRRRPPRRVRLHQRRGDRRPPSTWRNCRQIRGPRARGGGSCDGRDGSRVGPSFGPVGECEAAGLAGTTASPKRGGDDRAARGVHLGGPSQTLRSAVKHAAYRSFSAAGTALTTRRAPNGPSAGRASRKFGLPSAAASAVRTSCGRPRAPRPRAADARSWAPQDRSLERARRRSSGSALAA